MHSPKTPTEHVPARRTLRILYADDMRELRELAKAILARDGHSLECVSDGQLALQRISAEPAGFDVVITDHHMPRLNGLELVARLRELPYHGKILVFSSELSPSVHAAYAELKVSRVLHKPVLPSYLRQVLAEFQGV